jgi:hypothetical protein
MCKSGDTKTQERLDRLIELQKAANARQVSNDHSRDQGIHQNSSGYSLINVQSATFATGVGIGSLIFLLALGAFIYCYCRRKRLRHYSNRHKQLMDAVSKVSQSPLFQQPEETPPGRPPIASSAAISRIRGTMGYHEIPGHHPAAHADVSRSGYSYPAQLGPSASYSASTCGLPGCRLSFPAPKPIEWSPRITVLEEEVFNNNRPVHHYPTGPRQCQHHSPRSPPSRDPEKREPKQPNRRTGIQPSPLSDEEESEI